MYAWIDLCLHILRSSLGYIRVKYWPRPAPGLIRGRSSGHNNKIKIKLVPASNFNLHMHGAGDDCAQLQTTPLLSQLIFKTSSTSTWTWTLPSAEAAAKIRDLPAYFLFSLEQPTFQCVVNHKCHQSDILWHWFMTFMTFNIIRATIHS